MWGKHPNRNVTDNVIIFVFWCSFSINDTKKKISFAFFIVSLGSGNVTKGMGREG